MQLQAESSQIINAVETQLLSYTVEKQQPRTVVVVSLTGGTGQAFLRLRGPAGEVKVTTLANLPDYTDVGMSLADPVGTYNLEVWGYQTPIQNATLRVAVQNVP